MCTVWWVLTKTLSLCPSLSYSIIPVFLKIGLILYEGCRVCVLPPLSFEYFSSFASFISDLLNLDCSAQKLFSVQAFNNTGPQWWNIYDYMCDYVIMLHKIIVPVLLESLSHNPYPISPVAKMLHHHGTICHQFYYFFLKVLFLT